MTSLTGIAYIVDYDDDPRNIEGNASTSTGMVRRCSVGVNANLLQKESPSSFVPQITYNLRTCAISFIQIKSCFKILCNAAVVPLPYDR